MHVNRMGLVPQRLESTMKIGHPAENLSPLPASNGAAANAESAKAAKAAAAPAASTASAASTSAIPATADASAKIQLSNTATSLMSSGGGASFDADKVARISSAIDSGSFMVNPEAIADKLISNAKEVLTKIPD